MESEEEIERMQNYTDGIKLQQLDIILNHKFNINYAKNIYDFFELFKIRVLNQIIYENKYFNSYKKLYSLRNIYMQSSLANYNKKLKYTLFHYWLIKSHILKTESRIKYNKSIAFELSKTKQRKCLINILLKSIIKNEKIYINIPLIKRYFLLYLKYYNYLIENYYLKSITIVKAIFNYFRKKLKIYKAIFFSRINYSIQKDETFNIYKYILTNYINDKLNANNNKRKEAILLLENCNSLIKFDYNKYIEIFNKENFYYKLIDKIVINNFLINRHVAKFFSLWKKNSLGLSFIDNIHSKEILTDDLMFSKLLLLVLIVKKKIGKYSDFFLYKIKIEKQNKLLIKIKLESIYNNILFNVLKGINCLENAQNLIKFRIYNLSNDNKKLIALNKWIGQKNITCNNNYNNIIIEYSNLKILKGCHYFDNIYLSHKSNNRISHLIKVSFNFLLNNINQKYIRFKLLLFLSIIQNKIINIKRKITYHFLFEILRSQKKLKNLKVHISFLFSVLSKIFSLKLFKYNSHFFQKFKLFSNKTKILKSEYDLNKAKNDFFDINNKNGQIKNTYENLKYKSKAIKIIIKYYQKKIYKNNYSYSLNFAFIHWCSLIGKFPSFISKEKYSKTLEKEEEDEKKEQIKEIQELQNSIKEDKDFQHDLKAKISALNEENNFVNEKIFEITQRVEKCEKCNDLLKTSFVSENKIRTSIESIMKNAQEEENIIKKSRNILPDKKETKSSEINIVSIGTELIPKKPRDYIPNEESSEEDSMQIDDEDEGKNKKIKISNNDIISDTQTYKQKIINLKKEKEPIIEKLKEEINKLYQELNMD